MINVNQITSQLAKLPDQQLQNFAAMHKNDPYTVSLALAESNRRKDLRTSAQAKMAGQAMPKVVDQELAQMSPPQAQPQVLPEDVGIGQLPAQNLQKMAGGGIVAFDEGGEVPRYQNKGVVDSTDGPEAYRAYALKKAQEMGLDPVWVDRIFSHESKTKRSPMGYDPEAVSPTGATGIGQLVKNTANHYMRKVGHLGLQDQFDPEIRKDPYKNIDASMAYMADLHKKYNADPRLMAVAYNQGETYLDKHLKANEGKLNPAALKAEPKNYLQKTVESILPAAEAADLKSYNAIPAAVTKESRNAPVADTGERKGITGNQAVIGAGETGLQYLTGLAAIPTAGAYSLYRKAMYGEDPEANFRKYAGEVTYSPRTEGGKAVSEGFGRTLEDLKIPPYLAHMGNLSPRKGSPNIKADLAELAAERTRQAETPRLAGPSTDATMVQGRGEAPVKQGSAVAKQYADMQDAAAWREAAAKAGEGVESTRGDVIERNAAINRAQGIAAAVSPAVTAGIPSDAGTRDATKITQTEDGGAEVAPPEVKKEGIEKLLDASKGTTPDAGGNKYKDEMALQFFLGLMGGQSPNAMTNVSQAGLGALKYGQEAKKEESERAYKEALAKHYGVDPFVQRLKALQDPENMQMFKQMKELEREPMTREKLYTAFMSSPTAMGLMADPEKLNAAFKNYVSMYEQNLGPLGGLPSGVKVTKG